MEEFGKVIELFVNASEIRRRLSSYWVMEKDVPFDMENFQQQIRANSTKPEEETRITGKAKLQASDYQIDHEISTDQRHDDDCGKWIYNDLRFQAWFNNDIIGHSVLYVNGIPGAGKTILMSTVIEKLLESRNLTVKKSCVAYFYFKYKQPGKRSFSDLLRAILDQLIDQDPDMSDHLFDEISILEGTRAPSAEILMKLIKAVLESYHISYIVLDGLDECDKKEAKKSVEWFLSLMNSGSRESSATLRILFCGQRDGILDKLLENQPSISVEASGHVEDIRRYCRKRCERIQEKFDISVAMKEDIFSRVMDGAQGMFLYARVVLENLLNQTRLAGLKQEMEPSTFPRGIEKAYERVAVRIFEQPSSDTYEPQKNAVKILGWITCARRQLRWREVQSIFCIDPDKGAVNYEDGRLRVACKDLCGSLVDVHYATERKAGPEDILKLVHETARK
ncbi:hypothetical protein ABKA04_007312 [Annulohypoxylon sp. FPYF3050]